VNPGVYNSFGLLQDMVSQVDDMVSTHGSIVNPPSRVVLSTGQRVGKGNLLSSPLSPRSPRLMSSPLRPRSAAAPIPSSLFVNEGHGSRKQQLEPLLSRDLITNHPEVAR
jgi:hypothetical protein